MKKLIEIRCPKCTKMFCKIESGVKIKGIHFWCNRCQEEVEINMESRAQKPVVDK